ncbi:hypothetical protein KFL_003930130 [Klebsormidium nitens]|uniref:Uncharacterized protein n=1 Tax=Klebsormidium nitens TaxID=105231 RepID=A0A0U9HKH4_KLENI|nr:hypothetical protein KFL_003930130 [Klebsormidium nitens]|eukprot:GAQ88009.1 hypothetical protein KFL_003930130 [Klebsormidium nitens]
MEDGDLDRFVERCAALLTSESPEEILSGARLLKNALESAGETDSYSGKLQELAAFDGGFVLLVVLGRVLHAPSRRPGMQTYSVVQDYEETVSSDEDKQESNASDPLKFASTGALLRLTDSKVVVDFLLKDGAVARALAEEFTLDLTMGLQSLFYEDQAEVSGVETAFVRFGVDGLANLARTSKLFRDALKTDSQVWALEKGLLDIICTVFGSTHRREIASSLVADDDSRRLKCPARKCNLVLVRLIETEEALKKLQQLDAVSRLKVHKAIINAASP